MVLHVTRAMHIPPDQPPIRLEAGDVVRVGDADRVWPDFVFVLATNGVGWVPRNKLSEARPLATVLETYDTRELAVHAGARVELVHRDDSGWAWCRSTQGSEGWLPLSCLDLAPQG